MRSRYQHLNIVCIPEILCERKHGSDNENFEWNILKACRIERASKHQQECYNSLRYADALTNKPTKWNNLEMSLRLYNVHAMGLLFAQYTFFFFFSLAAAAATTVVAAACSATLFHICLIRLVVILCFKTKQVSQLHRSLAMCVAFPNVFPFAQNNRQQIFLHNKIVFILLYKVHTGTAVTTLTQYALSIRIYYYLSLCHA